MILDSSNITRLAAMLALAPLSANNRLVGSVLKVLDYGNRKHRNSTTGAIEHLEAAIRHLSHSDIDSETGEPHASHACARILLALLNITRSNS